MEHQPAKGTILKPSRFRCHKCYEVCSVEELNANEDMCKKCYRSSNGPKFEDVKRRIQGKETIIKETIEATTKILCAGSCGKHYSAQTLEVKGGYCARCYNIKFADQPVIRKVEPIVMPVRKWKTTEPLHETGVLCAGSCGKYWMQQTLDKNNGVCEHCNAILLNAPVDTPMPLVPREGNIKVLCAGSCGKYYLPQTLELNKGICGHCEHKAFKSRVPKKPSCSRCSSTRMMDVTAKCSDRCNVSLDGEDLDGYVPSNVNIGGGDYVEFKVCASCGQMSGSWPLPSDVMSRQEEDEEME